MLGGSTPRLTVVCADLLAAICASGFQSLLLTQLYRSLMSSFLLTQLYRSLMSSFITIIK